MEENKKIIIRLLRRLYVIDNLIPRAMRSNITCKENFDYFYYGVLDDIIDTMYYDFFSDIDDDSSDWGEAVKFIKEYISENYMDELKKYYIKKCEN